MRFAIYASRGPPALSRVEVSRALLAVGLGPSADGMFKAPVASLVVPGRPGDSRPIVKRWTSRGVGRVIDSASQIPSFCSLSTPQYFGPVASQG